MMLRRLSALLLLTLVAACGDSPTGPEKMSINGTWSGSTTGLNVVVTLSESRGSVTGSGNMSGPGGSIATQVSGTRAGASLSLTLSAQGYIPTNFTGTIQSKTTITGSLTGSGFTNLAITLTRQ